MQRTFFLSLSFIIAMCMSVPTAHAQHVATGNTKVTIKYMLRQAEDEVRGPNGRAYMITNQKIPLKGVSSGYCLRIGPGNPGLEFDAESSTFDSFYSRAYYAYENNKTVFVRYDNSYGSGHNCKLTSIEIID